MSRSLRFITHTRPSCLPRPHAQKGKARGAKQGRITREDLPGNLHSMSVSQLKAVCAAHGIRPRASTQAGIIRVCALDHGVRLGDVVVWLLIRTGVCISLSLAILSLSWLGL
jgi:hypothetical protein